jgi:hypothetical protein
MYRLKSLSASWSFALRLALARMRLRGFGPDAPKIRRMADPTFFSRLIGLGITNYLSTLKL